MRKANSAIIVAGQALNNDNSLGEGLIERVKKGCEIFKQNKSDFLIFSGYKQSHHQKSEAKAMKEYAVKHLGIEESVIVEESLATDTALNVIYSLAICRELNVTKCVFVSADFHIARCQAITKAVLERESVLSKQKMPPISFEFCASISPNGEATRKERIEREQMLTKCNIAEINMLDIEMVTQKYLQTAEFLLVRNQFVGTK